MRVVAKLQFTTSGTDVRLDEEVVGVVERWAARKFERIGDRFFIKQSGAPATFDHAVEVLNDQRLDRFTIVEPVDSGSLQTEVLALTDAGRIAFRCVLAAESSGGIAPADLSLRSPRFIRELVGAKHRWTIGQDGERVFAQSFAVDVHDVEQLETLLQSSKRRLPIVIVSELDGETLAGDLHERMAQDLCGLAHTIRLTGEAAWELTRRQGKEWSCYNGAVRLFWPFRANRDDFRNHPLWTSDQLMAFGATAVKARERIRTIVAARILEASTFVADDPAFAEFERGKVRDVIDQARAAAASTSDYQALAESYAEENAALRVRVDDLDTQIAVLRENAEALAGAMRSSREAATHVSETPPETVAEAVTIAREELSDRIIIADETDTYVAELDAAAGPPEKVLRYLRTLKELADALAAGPLGLSVPIWLRRRNVECSVESDTAKVSREMKRFRTRSVNGETVDCTFHAKPSDNVSPDRCVRIYFATETTAPFVKIGYIGRHVA